MNIYIYSKFQIHSSPLPIKKLLEIFRNSLCFSSIFFKIFSTHFHIIQTRKYFEQSITLKNCELLSLEGKINQVIDTLFYYSNSYTKSNTCCILVIQDCWKQVRHFERIVLISGLSEKSKGLFLVQEDCSWCLVRLVQDTNYIEISYCVRGLEYSRFVRGTRIYPCVIYFSALYIFSNITINQKNNHFTP